MALGPPDVRRVELGQFEHPHSHMAWLIAVRVPRIDPELRRLATMTAAMSVAVRGDRHLVQWKELAGIPSTPGERVNGETGYERPPGGG